MSELLEALGTIKAIGQQYANFIKVADAADKLVALVNHEEELKAAIVKLREEARLLQETVSVARQEELVKIADVKAKGEQALRGYEAKIADLHNELTTLKANRASEIAAAEHAAQAKLRAVQIGAAERQKAIEAERVRLEADHADFIERTKAHRAVIETKTAGLEAHLDKLREQAKGVLDAVQE